MESKVNYLDDTEVYLNEEEKLKVVQELLLYSNMMYKRVYVFEHFEAFSNSRNNDEPTKEYWDGLHYEKLIDHIKICIAIENYNKAMLLSHGYIIHAIDGNKNKSLAKKQRDAPVLIEDFMINNKFVKDEMKMEWYLEGLHKNFNTISFSQTLTSEYQKVIRLDERFLHYIKGINRKRNRLHLYKNYVGTFIWKNLLESIQYAKSYGTEIIENELNRLKDL